MNQPDSNFDQLSKLLALKKHEIPPPGYFNNFSGQVVTRIRRGESAKKEHFLGGLVDEAPWLFRILKAFEAKPAYAGVLASAMCLLLVAGIVYTDHPVATPVGFAPSQAAQASSSMASVSPSFLDQASVQASMISSTNPVMSLEPNVSSFGNENPLFQTVSFTH